MRRVVTGIDSAAKSVFTRDDQSPHYIAMGNFQMGELWWDPAAKISAGDLDHAEGKVGAVPALGEALMRYVVFPPRAEMEAMMASAQEQAPNHADEDSPSDQVSDDFQLEEDNPGMHTTETVDYGFVLEGELTLELDDGVKKLLKAGDSYIQNGTRHAWHNASDARAVLGVVMVGAER